MFSRATAACKHVIPEADNLPTLRVGVVRDTPLHGAIREVLKWVSTTLHRRRKKMIHLAYPLSPCYRPFLGRRRQEITRLAELQPLPHTRREADLQPHAGGIGNSSKIEQAGN